MLQLTFMYSRSYQGRSVVFSTTSFVSSPVSVSAFFKFEEEQRALSRVVAGKGTRNTETMINAWKRGLSNQTARW